MHDIRQGFIDDILAHPADDVPRLIYADWLTQRDDEVDERYGEFIALSVAGDTASQHRRDGLLLGYESLWWPEFADTSQYASTFRRGAVVVGALVTRGFPSTVYTTAAGWVEKGPKLVGRYPLEMVEFRDLQVQPSMGVFEAWWIGVGNAAAVFAPHMEIRHRYGLREQGIRDAASKLALDWARRRHATTLAASSTLATLDYPRTSRGRSVSARKRSAGPPS